MENRNRRSSILKVRQHVDIDIDETTVAGNGLPGASTTTMNRRVSFHNVKHVKQYDRDHGKLIDASPLREKITDTMDSDGILTPRGRNLDASETANNQTIRVFGNVDNGNQSVDMSLETVNENVGGETMQLFNITREPTMVFEKIVTTTTTVTERRMGPQGVLQSQAAPLDDTMALFNVTNAEEKDMTVDQTRMFAAPEKRLVHSQTTMNDSMDISVAPSDTPIRVNDTMALFRSPATRANESDMVMEKTNVFEQEEGKVLHKQTMPPVMNDSMDISVMPDDSPKNLRALLPNATLNQSVLMDLDESNAAPANNDTMALFNISTASVRDMDISNATIHETFKVPKSPARSVLPLVREENDDDVDMELTSMEGEKSIVQNQKTVALNDSMDISVAPVNQFLPVFPVVEQEEANQQNTLAPIVTDDAMDISVMPSDLPKNIDSNDTLALFQSPARQVNQSSQQPVHNVFNEPKDESVDMDITQTKEVATPQRMNVANKSVVVAPTVLKGPKDDSMEIEEAGAGEGTFVVPTTESPETSPEDILIPNIEQANMGGDLCDKIIVEEPSTVEKHEENRAVAEVSMMDVSGIEESPSHQKFPNLQASPTEESKSNSTLHESSVSHNDSSPKDTSTRGNESTLSPQKTMLVETDMITTLHDMSLVQKENDSEEMEEQAEVEEPEKTVTEIVEQNTTTTAQMIMSSLNTSSNRKPTSHASRRRSLLRESVLESPRRIALENSMITMNVAEMTALSEHRRRKSLQLNQQSVLNASNISMLNESLNMSKGRDIFALNTSVRSPHCHETTQSGNMSIVESGAAPETTSFSMPNFDPAVTKIVWLTPEVGEDSIPEAEDFARLVAAEKIKAKQHAQKTSENLDKEKAEAVRTGQWSKLSHDEKDAVLIARQDAEIRFLELRLTFAEKNRLKYEHEAKELLESNARIAEQLEDIENMESLQKEIEELKNRPTEADYERIGEEWRVAKEELFQLKHALLQQTLHIIMQMGAQKQQLKSEIEDRQKNLASLEAKETSEMQEMLKMMETL